MKKHIDTFGYSAEEFEKWWKESVNKMLKRAKRRNTEGEVRISTEQK